MRAKRFLIPLVAYLIVLVVVVNYIPQEAYILEGKPAYILEVVSEPTAFQFSPYGNYTELLSNCTFNISERYSGSYTLSMLSETLYAEPAQYNNRSATINMQYPDYFITISPVINVSEYNSNGLKPVKSAGNPWEHFEPNGSINTSVPAVFYGFCTGPDPFYWNHSIIGDVYTTSVFLSPGYYRLTVENVLAVRMPAYSDQWYQNGTTWFTIGGYEAMVRDVQYPGLWF